MALRKTSTVEPKETTRLLRYGTCRLASPYAPYVCTRRLSMPCIQGRFFEFKKNTERLASKTYSACVWHRFDDTARGFTLIELLIVVGILAIIGSFSLVFSLDSYRGYTFRNDRDLLVATLQRARNQAINNVCFGLLCSEGKSHGVHINGTQFVVFQTDTDYGGRDILVDELIEATGGETAVTGATDIVFERLSGKATVNPVGETLVVRDSSGHVSTIEFNSQGQIRWSN